MATVSLENLRNQGEFFQASACPGPDTPIYTTAIPSLYTTVFQAIAPVVIDYIDVSHDGVGSGDSVAIAFYRIRSGDARTDTTTQLGATTTVTATTTGQRVALDLSAESDSDRTFQRGDVLIMKSTGANTDTILGLRAACAGRQLGPG